MNVVFTGGGTGGHLYPLIATARAIAKKYPDAKILFIGNRAGVEANLVPEEGFEIKYISSAALSSNPVKLLLSCCKNTVALIQAIKLLSSFKPKFVVGSGGYVSAAVTLAAKFLKIPVIILEQNTYPGKTNRFAGKFAHSVCISFAAAEKYFPKGRTVLTGNPIRPEILSAVREQARRDLQIPEGNFTITVTGASQGAKSINEAILASFEKLGKSDWTLLHLTGKKKFAEFQTALESAPKPQFDYRVFAYRSDIATLYAASDLILCRAGATTLAEITAMGLPAILVPYPYAAENHQEKNAMRLQEAGAAVMIKDSEISQKLPDLLMELSTNRDKLSDMATKSRSLGQPDATANIMKVFEQFM